MSGHPWTDTHLALADRLRSLLDAMTLEEKVGQLHQVANAAPYAGGTTVRLEAPGRRHGCRAAHAFEVRLPEPAGAGGGGA